MTTLPLWLTTGYYALLGLAIGSFLNVVIARVPAKETLNTRSHCPKCGHPIRNRDNIPLLSWALLGGKCRDCRNPISWRYPAVEAGTAAAFAAIAWHYHIQIPNPQQLLLLSFAAVTITLTLIDIDTKTLPDVIVIPTFTAISLTLTATYLWNGQWEQMAFTAAAAATYTAFYFTLWFVTGGRGLGYGDVKLAPSIGAMAGSYGAAAATIGFFAPFILGGIPLGILLAARLIPRRTKIPFGPFMLAGGWVGIVAGGPIAAAYLSLFT